MRRIFSRRVRSGRSEERRQLRSDPGKEMGQHARGRAAPRRHRRACGLQAGATPVPRRVRRVLSKRSPHQKRPGKKVDRKYSRENWQCERPRALTENIQSNEVMGTRAPRVLFSHLTKATAKIPLFANVSAKTDTAGGATHTGRHA